MAASLAVFEFAGCAAPPASHPQARPARGRGGRFNVPPPEDTAACEQALTGSEFIFDVHTHHVIPAGPWVQNAPETTELVLSMLPAGCTDTDQLDCVDRASYLHDLFLASDTTVAVLTDVPNSGPSNAPIPFPDALSTQSDHGRPDRRGRQPPAGGEHHRSERRAVAATLEEMSSAVGGRPARPPSRCTRPGARPARATRSRIPTIGLPTVQHAHDLGVKVFVAHKGLPLVNFDPAFNHPEDMVARVTHVPRHAVRHLPRGLGPLARGGPLRPHRHHRHRHLAGGARPYAVPPNDNVWVDVATLWRQLLTTPDQAAHALGKVLSRVGAQRVLWGTDSIWYGSPEPQIMAMRTFEITPEFQETYDYPALTADVKAGLFGLNAAKLFGVDPTATRCGLTEDPLTANISESAFLRDEGALPSAWRPHGPTTRRQVLGWLRSSATAWVPS